MNEWRSLGFDHWPGEHTEDNHRSILVNILPGEARNVGDGASDSALVGQFAVQVGLDEACDEGKCRCSQSEGADLPATLTLQAYLARSSTG